MSQAPPLPATQHRQQPQQQQLQDPLSTQILPQLRDRIRGYVHDLIMKSHLEQQQSQRQSNEPFSSTTTTNLGATAAYWQAWNHDRHLVQTETDPLQFVRFTQYDLWAAAQRLCLYWTERVEVFGADRAFLPLTLTGTGALTDDDLLTLHAGYPSLLPDTTTGRKCLLFDRRKLIPNVTTVEHRLRCLFYVQSILAQEEGTQLEGALALIVYVLPRGYQEFDLRAIRRMSHLCSTIFPVKLELHLISVVPPRSGPRHKPYLVQQGMEKALNFLRSFYPSYLLQDEEAETEQQPQTREPKDNSSATASTNNPASPNLPSQLPSQSTGSTAADGGQRPATQPRKWLYYHLHKTKQEIYETLTTSHALTREGIPFFWGGDWKYEHFFEWCLRRKQWEQEHHKDKLLKQAPVLSSSKSGSGGSSSSQTSQSSKEDPDTGSSTKGKKKGDPSEDEEDAAAKKRYKEKKRKIADMLQARRKRERKHREVQLLQSELAQLQQENTQLKREHQFLEQCVETAMKLVPSVTGTSPNL